MNNNIDFLAIGDIAAEPFIKIKDASVHCDLDKENCKLCFDFGSKIPYESAEVCYAVGNSSNVAISASRFGLNSYLFSYVGNDDVGKKDIEKLIEENVHVDYIYAINGLESNYHYVLWYDEDRTILTKHTEFSYLLPYDLPEPKWLYLSSLASNSLPFHKEIIEYIKNHPNIYLVFQPGSFQVKLGVEPLKEIYTNTKIFLSNYEEAKKILGIEKDESSDRKGNIMLAMKEIHSLGPKVVVITDNTNGAYSYDGNEFLFMKIFPHNSFSESTGAGDAFSGAFVSALSMDKSIAEALMWGSANAVSVVSAVGPHKGLLNKEQIEEYLKDKMSDYKPIKLN